MIVSQSEANTGHAQRHDIVQGWLSEDMMEMAWSCWQNMTQQQHLQIVA